MINSSGKVYILCPAFVATGGPESLHLLCHTLRRQGIDSYMVYLNEGMYKLGHPGHGCVDRSDAWQEHIITQGKHETYSIYDTISTTDIDDNCDNTIIVPEIYLNALEKYNNITKVIWWLASRILPDGTYKEHEWFNFSTNREIYHLYNSKFAEYMLTSLNATNYFQLKTFVNENINFIDVDKQDIICYNPKKGYEFTSKIIQGLEYEFVPITGMSPALVTETLSKSKLYIDFGHHPGRERLPREAALCNCCVISSFNGSAMFFEDMPIPEKYKFNVDISNIESINNLITSIMNNYDTHINDFILYKNILNNNRSQFNLDVRNLIV